MAKWGNILIDAGKEDEAKSQGSSIESLELLALQISLHFRLVKVEKILYEQRICPVKLLSLLSLSLVQKLYENLIAGHFQPAIGESWVFPGLQLVKDLTEN